MNKTLLLVFTSLLGVGAFAQEAKVTPLLSKDIKEIPGKEGTMLVRRVFHPAVQIQSTGTTHMLSFTC